MEQTKICVDCKTSKTPLWRSGPAGPKSLCNACGIRFRKKKLRIKLMAIGKEVLLMKKVKRRKVQNREFGEVEQAAFLLMALSCGSVFG